MKTDLGRNLVYPPGAQRVWLSLVRQVHVSGHNSESDLAIEMNTYQGHDSRVEAVTVATDNDRQHSTHTQSGRVFPRARQC
jgi:hypothetical protein